MQIHTGSLSGTFMSWVHSSAIVSLGCSSRACLCATWLKRPHKQPASVTALLAVLLNLTVLLQLSVLPSGGTTHRSVVLTVHSPWLPRMTNIHTGRNPSEHLGTQDPCFPCSVNSQFYGRFWKIKLMQSQKQMD